MTSFKKLLWFAPFFLIIAVLTYFFFLKNEKIITSEEAQTIALTDAKISSSNAKFLALKLESEDGKKIYEIEFTDQSTEFDYQIDAKSGAIIDKTSEALSTINLPSNQDSQNQNKTSSTSSSTTNRITEQEALNLALQDAGLDNANVHIIQNILDSENGQAVYEIDFVQGTTEYNYDIHAETGAILQKEIDSTLD